MKIIECENCGKRVVKNCGNQKYCAECRELVKSERHRKWQQQQKKPVEIIKCAICGKDIERVGNTKKYCKDCRKQAAEIRRKEALELKRLDKISPKNYTESSISSKQTADEITIKAKREHLSYGQYSLQHGCYDKIYGRV